ncbi:hypothetical protein DFH06DRAFT_697576 [Mycena polygramma]|nr:hypothetical protein DFH06DRAFT_697576 [Mycena polygramma]
MSYKSVHFNPSVDEYAAYYSPESCKSSLPSRGKSVQWNPTVDVYSTDYPPESCTSSPRRTSHRAPPSTPSPSSARAIELHPALTTKSPLLLDFSFPSDAFRRHPHLMPLLDAPACNPPRASVIIRIESKLYTVRLEVRHGPTGQVTVGDVVTQIQQKLRQPDAEITDTSLYMKRRIETVNAYCQGLRDPQLEKHNANKERAVRGRVVDNLLGHTQFAGLDVRPDQCWELKLTVPPRYRS